MEQRRFEIASAEGLPIRGVLELPPEPRGLVVVVHGFKGFKDWGFFPWISARLGEFAVASVRFDMSRSGIGERPGEFDRLDLFAGDTYGREIDDLRRVLDWTSRVEELDTLPLFLMGHSRGAGVAILTARALGDGPIRGIVTWSGIARANRWSEETRAQWRRDGVLEIPNQRTGQIMRISAAVLDELEQQGAELDILAAASSLECPLLIVHGRADETVPATEAEDLAGATKNASLVLIDNASHTFGAKHPLDGIPRELSFAMHATLGFVNAYCRARWMAARMRQ